MSHDDLVAWVGSLWEFPLAYDAKYSLFERLGYISNIETLNSAADAQTPAQALEQNREPEFDTTSIRISSAYLQDKEAANAKFKGHRFKVTGVLADAPPNPAIMDLYPKNPPRASFLIGWLGASGKFDSKTTVLFYSKSKYSLSDSQKLKFRHSRSPTDAKGMSTARNYFQQNAKKCLTQNPFREVAALLARGCF